MHLATGRRMINFSIAPRMSGREDPFVRGASTALHAALARIEPIALDPEDARHAHAYVANPSAIELAGRILDPQMPPDYEALQSLATHISPADLWTAHQLMDTAHLEYGQEPGTAALRDALAQAARSGKSLVLVNGNSRFSGASRQKSFREEIHHAMQADLRGGENLIHHMGRSRALFLRDVNERTAARALDGRGYRNISGGQMAAEIGVRLMDPGRFGELGLQYKQARSLAAHYLRALRIEYGHAPPRDIALEIFRSLRKAIR